MKTKNVNTGTSFRATAVQSQNGVKPVQKSGGLAGTTRSLTLMFGACLIIGLGIVVSCSKEEVKPTSATYVPEKTAATDETSQNFSDKSLGLTVGLNDPFLIAAIIGADPAYRDVNELELMLIDHAPLTTAVLTVAINSPRLSDEAIELLTIVSAPAIPSVKALLHTSRPHLVQSAIDLAIGTNGQKFLVAHTNPKTIIFGSSLTKLKKIGECAQDCSSRFQASADSRMISLTSINVSASIGGGPHCDSQKHTCGFASIVSKSGRDTAPVYTVVCNQNYDFICINSVFSSL